MKWLILAAVNNSVLIWIVPFLERDQNTKRGNTKSFMTPAAWQPVDETHWKHLAGKFYPIRPDAQRWRRGKCCIKPACSVNFEWPKGNILVVALRIIVFASACWSWVIRPDFARDTPEVVFSMKPHWRLSGTMETGKTLWEHVSRRSPEGCVFGLAIWGGELHRGCAHMVSSSVELRSTP